MKTLKMVIVASLISGSLNATSIPLIGLDAKGNAVEEVVSEMEFNGWMKKAVLASSEMIKEDPQMKTEEQAGLKLKQVDIGLGFKAEVGLGDVVKASAEPTITFKFKRSN